MTVDFWRIEPYALNCSSVNGGAHIERRVGKGARLLRAATRGQNRARAVPTRYHDGRRFCPPYDPTLQTRDGDGAQNWRRGDP
jgi:hypothetical protein